MTAVVTGIGVVAPNGMGTSAYWSATKEGRSGIGPIRRFDASGYPVQVAGEVTEFVAKDHVPSRLIAQTDRMTHFALAGTEWALADAAAEPKEIPDFQASVITANSSGGFEFGQRELANLWTKGSTYVGAYQSIAWFYAANTGQISIRHGMRGPCGVIASEQAGGIDALAQARRALRGGTQLVVSGGTDASLCPWGFITQIPAGRLSRRNDPEFAYLPFDVAASGFVAGEGGAMLIVEDAKAARARGASQVYGEIAGYGATFDPRPGSDRPPGLRRAIILALADAGLSPRQVDVVFADAMGAPDLDLVEARTLAEVFGPYGVPVTAPKTMTGRLYAGGAALDAATALLAIRDSVVPPTVAVSEVVPGYDLDLVVGAARHMSVRAALVIARGHGGFNAALILRAVR
jgi:act minimal PKS chain-length factor (CLF/KS beta)